MSVQNNAMRCKTRQYNKIKYSTVVVIIIVITIIIIIIIIIIIKYLRHSAMPEYFYIIKKSMKFTVL